MADELENLRPTVREAIVWLEENTRLDVGNSVDTIRAELLRLAALERLVKDGITDAVEAELAAIKAAHNCGMGTTPGMWDLLSEELDGAKLPESLNAALYALREGKAVVFPK